MNHIPVKIVHVGDRNMESAIGYTVDQRQNRENREFSSTYPHFVMSLFGAAAPLPAANPFSFGAPVPPKPAAPLSFSFGAPPAATPPLPSPALGASLFGTSAPAAASSPSSFAAKPSLFGQLS